MQDNTATAMRDAIEFLMGGISADDPVYSALAACITRLNAIAWNRFAESTQHAAEARTALKRRAAFITRHKRGEPEPDPFALTRW